MNRDSHDAQGSPDKSIAPRSAENSDLERERRFLADLETRPFGERVVGYLKLIGPGYMQSALTLGAGTAASTLFAGAVFGYKLLWVAPVGMLLGVIMFMAIAHQTLSTGVRPFDAVRRFAGAPFAYGWAAAALLSSVIWHFPQYSLAGATLSDIGTAAGLNLPRPAAGALVLVWAIILSMMYGTSNALIRWYERLLKYLVWLIIACFLAVVVRTGISDWGALVRGFLAFEVPAPRNGVSGTTLVVSGLAAAVGVNMTFLYPYSLLSRGWGREHRRLARFDLWSGMFVPYVLATSLMLIATANTIYLDPSFKAASLSPIEASRILAAVIGPTLGRVIFNLGLLAMALSTISLHMVACGFVCSELFGWKIGDWRYRLAMLLPTPGVLGTVFWAKMAVWVAVPTNIICGFLLPLAYLAFVRLQVSRKYLGDDRPRGLRGAAALAAMILSTALLTGFLAWQAWQALRPLWST
ncbi:MAG: Divalent metal cation transporter MntH [Phycisphaerae bacterium]|nr:Divalent metal cation transporter MntH [Phycisphaerae bacterium]